MDISIIIATCNRLAGMQELLASFDSLDCSGLQCEVLVVDNGGRSETFEFLEDYRLESMQVRSFFIRNGGKNRALNLGLEEARGEFIVFTDDDVIPRPDWLQCLWAAHHRWPDNCVFGGRINPLFPGNTPAWLKNPDYVPSSGAYSQFPIYECAEEGPVDNAPFGPNMAAARVTIGSHRFDIALGPGGTLGIPLYDEIEFMVRVLNASGGRCVLVPSAVVEHKVRPEQLGSAWLLHRALLHGRAQEVFRYSKDQHNFNVAGMPLNLFMGYLISWIQGRCNFFLSAPQRFRHRWRSQKRLGRVQMFMRLYRTPKDSDIWALRNVRLTPLRDRDTWINNALSRRSEVA